LWRGNVAYGLDWGEGDIGNSILKAFYHKLALSTSLTKLKNFVMTHDPGLPPDRLYRHSKHVAQKLSPVLHKNGIEIKVLLVRRMVKAN
jgi:hypothetical protein